MPSWGWKDNEKRTEWKEPRGQNSPFWMIFRSCSVARGSTVSWNFSNVRCKICLITMPQSVTGFETELISVFEMQSLNNTFTWVEPEDEAIIKSSIHGACNKAELCGGRRVTFSSRDKRLSVFLPPSQLRHSDNWSEWFHLSYQKKQKNIWICQHSLSSFKMRAVQRKVKLVLTKTQTSSCIMIRVWYLWRKWYTPDSNLSVLQSLQGVCTFWPSSSSSAAPQFLLVHTHNRTISSHSLLWLIDLKFSEHH